MFEVAIDERVYRVEGKALQRWIAKKRQELKGPRGYLFMLRPTLE
jgi:hypothetical protein